MKVAAASSGGDKPAPVCSPQLKSAGFLRCLDARPRMPYFDHNATTPLSPAAREIWLRASEEHWHNPSSLYRDAAKARIRLEGAHERVAEFLGSTKERIVFTSGATESAHAVLQHWERTFARGAKIAVNPTEHPCVLAAANLAFGERIVWLPVDRDGVVTVQAVREVVSGGQISGVIVMAANNETGVLQPWPEIARICRAARIQYFCDAAQWLGKLPASGFSEVDWLIASGHKFGAPKGVGCIKLAEQSESFSTQPGGGQESGHRGGTENLASSWALATALAEAEQKKVFLEGERLRWREEFERSLIASLPGTRIVAMDAERLWNTVSAILPTGENHRWVTRLDKRGFQVSTGSACASGKEGPSHVLAAMGVSAEESKRVIRVSAGWETTLEDWRGLAAALAEVAKEMRGAAESVTAVP